MVLNAVMMLSCEVIMAGLGMGTVVMAVVAVAIVIVIRAVGCCDVDCHRLLGVSVGSLKVRIHISLLIVPGNT